MSLCTRSGDRPDPTVLSWLLSHWALPPGNLPDRARLIELQIEPFSTPRHFDALILWLTAALVVWCAVPTLAPTHGALWLAALALNPTSKFWLPVLMRWLRPNQRIRLRWLCAQACITALLFAQPLLWIYGQTDSTTLRVFLIVIGLSMLHAEGVSYHRLPPVVLCWMVSYLAVVVQVSVHLPAAQAASLMVAAVIYLTLATKESLQASKDLMRRAQAEFEAERQSENLALMLNDIETSSRDWFWECDAEGRLTHASVSMSTGLGRAGSLHQVLLTEALASHVHKGALESWSALTRLADRLRAGRPFRDMTIPLDIDGQRCWWSLGAKPLLNPDGELTGWRGTAVDVSEERRNAQALTRLAATDALTHLDNRRSLQSWLDARLDPATGSTLPVALLLLDIDRFKGVNDAHGHAVGDHLLRAVAERLSSTPMPFGRWFRLGGDEFALCVSPPPAAAVLQHWGEQLLARLSEPHHIQDLRLEIRASLGLACAPVDATTTTDLLQAADIALHAAKARGGQRLHRIDDDTRRRVKLRARMIHDLARALERDELHLSYQPLFDARTGLPVGAEALLRWNHPELGAISPETFIELAESTGLIVPIGAWALERACRDAAHWPPSTRLAVNLSARQLESAALIPQVQHALQASGLPARRLELEVTETALVDEAQAGPTLLRLKALGVMLILDDFGTGYSALGYLQRLTFDGLKVDRSFVRPLKPGQASQADAMLRAIVDMAHALALPCTAEGVESEHQKQRLLEVGCHTLQGYHLAPPMTPEQVLSALRAPAGTGPWSPAPMQSRAAGAAPIL